MLRAQDEEKSEQKTFPIETLHTVRSLFPRSGVVFFFRRIRLTIHVKDRSLPNRQISDCRDSCDLPTTAVRLVGLGVLIRELWYIVKHKKTRGYKY